jgi:hypothetical protein
MRLDQLSVALRPRTSWEAMDLGQALVRRHARATWGAWFALTLPAWLLCNALAYAADAVWVAALAMWWLKPLFDRALLFVLSRAVFGAVPGVRDTLRARAVWRPGQVAAWLTWRRPHPSRAVLLPVDLLEAPRGAVRSARVRVLQQAIQAPAWGLTAVALALEAALFFAVLVGALQLLPVPLAAMPETAQEFAEILFVAPPRWAQLVVNAVLWLATSLVEPFYVGAGFGLYLSRRTQLEAWDVELAFRRLAERARALAAGSAVALLLALPLAAIAPDALAARAPTKQVVPKAKDDCACGKADRAVPVRELFGPAWRAHDGRFARDVGHALADPDLAPKETVQRWKLRRSLFPDLPTGPKVGAPKWIEAIGALFAAIGEYGLWLVAGVLLALLLWKLPKWLPWMRDLRSAERAPSPIIEHPDAVVVPLPDDVPAAVRALWQAGRAREALALLYRASVERLADTLGTALPPGATEAECLRRARRLADEGQRGLFTRVVRTWQAAAYARRLPDAAAFEDLLAAWSAGGAR